MQRTNYCLVTILSSLVLVGCGGSSSSNNNDTSELDSELVILINKHELIGDPSLNRTLPDISEPLPQLGKILFFSKALSGDMDTACVSCHHPMHHVLFPPLSTSVAWSSGKSDSNWYKPY